MNIISQFTLAAFLGSLTDQTFTKLAPNTVSCMVNYVFTGLLASVNSTSMCETNTRNAKKQQLLGITLMLILIVHVAVHDYSSETKHLLLLHKYILTHISCRME